MYYSRHSCKPPSNVHHSLTYLITVCCLVEIIILIFSLTYKKLRKCPSKIWHQSWQFLVPSYWMSYSLKHTPSKVLISFFTLCLMIKIFLIQSDLINYSTCKILLIGVLMILAFSCLVYLFKLGNSFFFCFHKIMLWPYVIYFCSCVLFRVTIRWREIEFKAWAWFWVRIRHSHTYVQGLGQDFSGRGIAKEVKNLKFGIII